MRTSYPILRTITFASAMLLTFQASKVTVSANATNSSAPVKSESFAVQPPFIEPAIPQSAFNQPKRPAEGRDPFFPKSIYPYGIDPTPKPTTNAVPTVADLTLKGISGTPEQPLAIINNRTVTAGEETDVPIGAGKIRIRCVEINMAEGTVTVQVGGQSRQLRLPSK